MHLIHHKNLTNFGQSSARVYVEIAAGAVSPFWSDDSLSFFEAWMEEEVLSFAWEDFGVLIATRLISRHFSADFLENML